MAPQRVMFIRHAEKPPGVPPYDGDGVDAKGKKDEESLTVRGWQRAGALAKFFESQPKMCPNAVFASGDGKHSKSERPVETVTPLVDLLTSVGKVAFIDKYLKDDGQKAIDDVMKQIGIVLVAWQHELIPSLIGMLKNPPANVPQQWPGDRFDMVWVCDSVAGGWSFSQVPQLLLAGDSAKPIPIKAPSKQAD